MIMQTDYIIKICRAHINYAMEEFAACGSVGSISDLQGFGFESRLCTDLWGLLHVFFFWEFQFPPTV